MAHNSAEYNASEEDNEDSEGENDIVFDPDAVDLRRLAAEARAGPLLRAVQAKRAELKELNVTSSVSWHHYSPGTKLRP